jgi:hypothetical protein
MGYINPVKQTYKMNRLANYWKYYLAFVTGAAVMGIVCAENWGSEFDRFAIQRRAVIFVDENFRKKPIDEKAEYEFIPGEIDTLSNGVLKTKVYASNEQGGDTFVVFLREKDGIITPFKAKKCN